MYELGRNLMYLALGLVILSIGLQYVLSVIFQYQSAFIIGGLVIGAVMAIRYLSSRSSGGLVD